MRASVSTRALVTYAIVAFIIAACFALPAGDTFSQCVVRWCAMFGASVMFFLAGKGFVRVLDRMIP